MAFLSLLVEAGTFRKIIVSFLPVGHTHEDIDQFFSRIAMALRRNDAHSRLELERIIRETRCSSSEWGSVNLVRHWENVANIKGWLEQHGVVKMKAITGFQQFRFMKAQTTAEVLLQAREWPGMNEDYWSGFTANQINQPIWACEDVPNLLVDYDNVPNGLGPKEPVPESKIAKTRKGVENQLDYLKASDSARADMMQLLKVYSTPADSFSFAWDKDDICALLGDKDRHLVVGAVEAGEEAEVDEWKPKIDCEIIENCYYLMQPPVGNNEPFWLGKVRKRVLNNGVKMAHVQWWEPTTDQLGLPVHARDYFRCAYGAAKSNPSGAPITSLDLLDITEGFTIQLCVKMVGKGFDALHIVPGRADCNFAKIKWYMERWAPESNMHLEEDERIPHHLMVQGRVDTPAPRVRKPRSKNPAEESKAPAEKGDVVTPAQKARKPRSKKPAEESKAPAEKGDVVTPAPKARPPLRAPEKPPTGVVSKRLKKK